MTTTIVQMEEEEFQVTIMALAMLSRQKPGWDDMLSRMAKKMDGLELFESFKSLNTEWAMAWSEERKEI